jgi:hypothetical protein
MLIKNAGLQVELAGDVANMTIYFDVWIMDGDVEKHGGIREIVRAEMPEGNYPYYHNDLLPADQAVKPHPTANWKELHRTHRFAVRRPLGLRSQLFKAHAQVTPLAKYTDEEFFVDFLPPNLSAINVIRAASSWAANLVSKLWKRPGG